MKHLQLHADDAGHAATKCTTYAEFSKATRRDWLSYRGVFRGKTPELSPDQAQIFIRDWIAKHCDASLYDRLIEQAQDDGKLNGLGLVCAAIIAMRQENFKAAADLAKRAYAADQHEVFAQRIFLAAEEGRSDLHLDVDDWLEDRFCENPFTDVEIIGSKDVYTCCAAWLPASIGAAEDETQDIWRGQRAKELRRSVLDGDFSYCSRLNCPKIAGRQLPRKSEVTDPKMRAHIDRRTTAEMPPPDRVLFSYDTSCNLSCPSCRLKLISLGRKQAEKLDDFYFEHVTKFSDTATRIKITGSGDPFGSNHFRRVLKHMTSEPAEQPRLQLQTNGVLFDERAWNDLNLESHVRSVWISVDATEAETYAKLRRRGDFERLMSNLEFLAAKRRAGSIGELRLDFVVQADNYKQMPKFAEIAQSLGADGVHFLMLRNWGTFSTEEFQSMAITFETHPDHQDFLRVLKDPRLGAKGVDLGNLAPMREKALATAQPEPAIVVAPKAKAIVVLGVPRIGSNYLFGCLGQLDDLLVVKEVFNPSGAFGLETHEGLGLQHFNQTLDQDFRSIHDETLIDHLRSHPAEAIETLRALADANEKSAVVMKIFQTHIDQSVLEDRILADPDVIPVLQHRPLLACYISWIKAQRTQKWANHDVTDLKPDLCAQTYLDWQEQTIRWYRAVEDAIYRHGKPVIYTGFDDVVSPEPHDMLRAFAKQIDPFVKLSALRRNRFEPPNARQDKVDDVFLRISNGAMLKQQLVEQGQLETALRSPV